MMQTKGTLSNGVEIPLIGFGTWEIPNDTVAELVTKAIACGYRLIDTARIYDNELGVGKGIAAAYIDRDELFVTTKLWNDDQGYDSTLSAIDGSLERLQLDYIDLYLIHWPASSRRHESWRAMEEIYKQGKAKAVGVSNYTIEHLQELMQKSSLVPTVNQIEFHPFIYEQQLPLLEFCAQHNITIEAYSPINRLRDAKSEIIRAIAKQYGKTEQQVVLRWCVQHNTVPLPRSTSSNHAASNIQIFDFELDDQAMQQLNGLSDGERVTWDPAGMGQGK